ncbi:hypothetical protein EZS27_031665 [termite gut metagenome]|uniref:Uncharacterized protein n=1 Tax=termite gut metagenome TaxID=433724 RepID=A0A5J4QA12_9ZZZZ
MFYRATREHRRTEIYLLENEIDLMGFLDSIYGNIEEYFCYEKLIPQKFASPEVLLLKLSDFKRYLNDNQKFLDCNYKGEDTSYIVVRIQEIKDELIQMIDYVREVYDYENTVIPYVELRHNLIVLQNNKKDSITQMYT